MELLAKCPRCGEVIHLKLGDADRRKRCTKCRSIFKVPDIDHLQEALKVIQKANTTIYVDQGASVTVLVDRDVVIY